MIDSKNESSDEQNRSPEQTRLYVSQLPRLVLEDALQTGIDQTIAHALECKIVQTNAQTNYALVTFLKSDEEMVLSREWECCGLKLQFQKDSPKEFKIFIRGLTGLTEEDIRKFFGQYGKVTQVMTRGYHGNSKGFGFVVFEDGTKAQTLIRTRVRIGNNLVWVDHAKSQETIRRYHQDQARKAIMANQTPNSNILEPYNSRGSSPYSNNDHISNTPKDTLQYFEDQLNAVNQKIQALQLKRDYFENMVHLKLMQAGRGDQKQDVQLNFRTTNHNSAQMMTSKVNVIPMEMPTHATNYSFMNAHNTNIYDEAKKIRKVSASTF